MQFVITIERLPCKAKTGLTDSPDNKHLARIYTHTPIPAIHKKRTRRSLPARFLINFSRKNYLLITSMANIVT